jgi:hypothetical protein
MTATTADVPQTPTAITATTADVPQTPTAKQ